MLGVVFDAVSPLHAIATAAELQRWSGGEQPTFTLPDTNGVDIALATKRGHVVLVHFFATWCEPCREELPALNRLATRADGAVKVLAISVAEVDLRVRRFIESTPVNFPVLLDRDRAVVKAWNVLMLPTTFVLDENLNPKLVVETDFAWDSIDPANLAGMLAANARERAASTNAIVQSTNQGEDDNALRQTRLLEDGRSLYIRGRTSAVRLGARRVRAAAGRLAQFPSRDPA